MPPNGPGLCAVGPPGRMLACVRGRIRRASPASRCGSRGIIRRAFCSISRRASRSACRRTVWARVPSGSRAVCWRAFGAVSGRASAPHAVAGPEGYPAEHPAAHPAGRVLQSVRPGSAPRPFFIDCRFGHVSRVRAASMGGEQAVWPWGCGPGRGSQKSAALRPGDWRVEGSGCIEREAGPVRAGAARAVAQGLGHQ